MPVLLQACAIVAALIVLPLAWLIRTAPLGYEDASGFHRVEPKLRNLRETHDAGYTK